MNSRPSAGAAEIGEKSEVATKQQILDFYASPGPLTSAGEYAALFDPLPSGVEAVAHIVQGLAVHEFVAFPYYHVSIPEQRRSESHIRRVDRMLDTLLAIDDKPLSVPRSPDKRLVGLCHHFALFLAAILRSKGVAARARWGFGSYFNPGFFEDHVVCEYWNPHDARWVRVDAQLDEVWQEQLHIDFDPLDVPHDRFVIAGDAWTSCRAGQADAAKFGIFRGNLRGLWFVATDLVRDVACLNKMELLPWDVWGGMPHPDTPLIYDQLAFFDRLATLTRSPDSSFDELRALYDDDDRLHVPATVFNAILNRPEPV